MSRHTSLQTKPLLAKTRGRREQTIIAEIFCSLNGTTSPIITLNFWMDEHEEPLRDRNEEKRLLEAQLALVTEYKPVSKELKKAPNWKFITGSSTALRRKSVEERGARAPSRCPSCRRWPGPRPSFGRAFSSKSRPTQGPILCSLWWHVFLQSQDLLRDLYCVHCGGTTV